MLITITGKENNMTIDELKEGSFEIGMALNRIAMMVDDATYEKIKAKMDLIEDIALKWYDRLKELEEAGEDDRK